MAEDSYLLVVAIDFGTTFSGYAFSFKTKPDEIRMNKSWGADLAFQSYKTPTSVLVNPKGKFEAFGFEAEQQYANLEDDIADKYALFEKFKMKLHGQVIFFILDNILCLCERMFNQFMVLPLKKFYFYL